MGHNFDELSGKVIGIAIDVHKELGPGFLESIYENALAIALREAGLRIATQVQVPVLFRGNEVGRHVLDIVVENALVLELKAIKRLEDVHYAQLRSYLKATTFEVGLLMNFNAPTLAVKRLVN